MITSYPPIDGILYSARTGNSVFLQLAREYKLYPSDPNELNSDRLVKALTRLVACVVLNFFLNLAFSLNLIGACIKGCLAIVCKKNHQRIGDYNAAQYIQDAKRHIISMIIDIGVYNFTYYYYGLFVLCPSKLEKHLIHLQKIVYKAYPLDVGEEPIFIVDNSNRIPPPLPGTVTHHG